MADAERQVACRNRRARHDYHIEETIETGIALSGSEVKSLRLGKANLTDAYAAVRGGQLWLLKAKIEPYEQANRANHLLQSRGSRMSHRITYDSRGDAGVAQLAEHLLPKQRVAGSNPVSRSRPRM